MGWHEPALGHQAAERADSLGRRALEPNVTVEAVAEQQHEQLESDCSYVESIVSAPRTRIGVGTRTSLLDDVELGATVLGAA